MTYVKQVFQNTLYDCESLLWSECTKKCHDDFSRRTAKSWWSIPDAIRVPVRRDCIRATVRGWPQITSRPSLAALADCPQPCHAVEIMAFAWITIQDWMCSGHWK